MVKSKTKKTAPKKTSTTKKTQQTIASSDEKQQLLNDMKRTMKDMGRLPGLIFAPVIGFVSSKYDSIPQERREHLKAILENIKKGGEGSLSSLKERFSSLKNGEDTKPTKKKSASTKKKPKKVISKSATKSKKKPEKIAGKVTTGVQSGSKQIKKTVHTASGKIHKATATKTASKKTTKKKTTTKK